MEALGEDGYGHRHERRALQIWEKCLKYLHSSVEVARAAQFMPRAPPGHAIRPPALPP